MNKPCLQRSVAAVAAVAATALALFAAAASQAQALTAVAAPAPAASSATQPGPRLLSPPEKRGSAELPANVRAEDAVVPQITIPLGKAAARPLPLPPSTTPGRGAAVSPGGGINDSIARCEAQVDPEARKECRDRLARVGRKPSSP